MGSIGNRLVETNGESTKINTGTIRAIERKIRAAQLPEDLDTVIENIQNYKNEFPDSYDKLRELELQAKRDQVELRKMSR